MSGKATQSLRKGALILIIAMGLLMLVASFLKMTRLTTNPRSRVITVERLVDVGTWAHQSPTDTTRFELSVDAVKVGDRLYSSKPPIYPLLMAGESLALKSLTGWNFYDHKVDYLRLILILNQIFPYLLMLWASYIFLRKYTDDPWTIYFMLLALGIGSLSYAYAVTINNHSPASLLYVFIFLLWMRINSGEKSGAWWYLLLGLMAGFAFSIELPSGVLGAWFILLALIHGKWKGSFAILGFVLPALLSLWIYHHLSGKWVPFYLQPDLYRYAGSYWLKPEGMDLLNPSKPSYIFHMLFGFRGLFSHGPLLLIGLLGLVKMAWGKKSGMQKEAWGIGLGILVLMVFVVMRTYNYGGVSVGMRWFICFMPLLMLMGFREIEFLGKSFLGRVVCILLLLWSVPIHLEVMFEEAFIAGMFERWWDAVFW